MKFPSPKANELPKPSMLPATPPPTAPAAAKLPTVAPKDPPTAAAGAA